MLDVLPFIRSETIELGETLPFFSPLAGEVGHVASMEGGDVAWFLAMRVGIAYLDPENRSLSSDESDKIVGLLGILAGLSIAYRTFDPEGVALEVAQKNIANYPSRVLRAHPKMTPHRMAREYDNVRLPVLKAFRRKLVDRKIPPVIYEAIQQANPEIPRVPELKRGAIKLYQDVIPYAQAAGKYYRYPVAA